MYFFCTPRVGLIDFGGLFFALVENGHRFGITTSICSHPMPFIGETDFDLFFLERIEPMA